MMLKKDESAPILLPPTKNHLVQRRKFQKTSRGNWSTMSQDLQMASQYFNERIVASTVKGKFEEINQRQLNI